MKLNYLLLHIRNILFVFSHCDGWLIWNLAFVLFSLLFIYLWNRKPWLYNFMFIITLVCSKLWIWMGIYFRYILLIRISRGTSNCVQHVFEKKNKHLFHNDISPHFKFLFLQWSLDFWWFFKIKIKRINNAHLFPQPSLIIFTKGTNNSDHVCI